MTDKKVSQLGAASTLTGTELIELVQGGANVKSTAQAIANLSGGGSSVKQAFGKFIGSPGPPASTFSSLNLGNCTQFSTGQFSVDISPAGFTKPPIVKIQVDDGGTIPIVCHVTSGQDTSTIFFVFFRSDTRAEITPQGFQFSAEGV